MIFRARTAEFLLAKPVLKLFEEAYAQHPCYTADQVLKLLIPIIGQPHVGVFIAEEKGELVGLGVVHLPVTPGYNIVEVQDFYNAGSAAARQDLLKAMVGFVKENGYNKAWLVNQAGNPDKAMARFVKDVATCRPVGSILELDLK